jgi:hypothetical protein
LVLAKNLRSLLISLRLAAEVADEDAEVDGSDTTNCSWSFFCSLTALFSIYALYFRICCRMKPDGPRKKRGVELVSADAKR